MPIKIKLIITFLVITISIFIFYKHYILNQQLRGIIIFIVGTLMLFGLWVLPEATGKIKQKDEKK